MTRRLPADVAHGRGRGLGRGGAAARGVGARAAPGGGAAARALAGGRPAPRRLRVGQPRARARYVRAVARAGAEAEAQDSPPCSSAGQLPLAALPAGRVGAGAGAHARAALPRLRAGPGAAQPQVSPRPRPPRQPAPRPSPPRPRRRCSQYFRAWTEDAWRGGGERDAGRRLLPLLLATLTGCLYTIYCALFAVHAVAVWAVEPLAAEAEDKAGDLDAKITDYEDLAAVVKR